jgi:hypothetical protein
MIPALALALSLMLADTPPAPDDGGGEPLPPGAPTESYQLSAWCYGALDEYLAIYQKVKPDLRDIDHMFGTSVVEDEPYHSDMAAARVELKVIGDSVTDAEKASPRPIADQGAQAIQQGRSIWSVAEAKSHRELARAWMLWALPDRCASNAKELAQRSLLFGKALGYNNAPVPSVPENAPQTAPQTDTAPATDTAAPTDAAPGANEAAPPPAADPNAQASPTTDTNVPAPPPTTDASGAPEAPTPTSPEPSAGSDPALPPYPTAPVPGDAPPADQPPQAASPQP